MLEDSQGYTLFVCIPRNWLQGVATLADIETRLESFRQRLTAVMHLLQCGDHMCTFQFIETHRKAVEDLDRGTKALQADLNCASLEELLKQPEGLIQMAGGCTRFFANVFLVWCLWMGRCFSFHQVGDARGFWHAARHIQAVFLLASLRPDPHPLRSAHCVPPPPPCVPTVLCCAVWPGFLGFSPNGPTSFKEAGPGDVHIDIVTPNADTTNADTADTGASTGATTEASTAVPTGANTGQ